MTWSWKSFWLILAENFNFQKWFLKHVFFDIFTLWVTNMTPNCWYSVQLLSKSTIFWFLLFHRKTHWITCKDCILASCHTILHHQTKRNNGLPMYNGGKCFLCQLKPHHMVKQTSKHHILLVKWFSCSYTTCTKFWLLCTRVPSP